MTEQPNDATALLAAHVAGDQNASDRFFVLVYEKLRGTARRYMRGERPGHTLQPTALVHEAYMRMIDANRVDWRSKTHFFAAAASQMRRILVEHARAAARIKRGARPVRVTLDEGLAVSRERVIDLLALDEGLDWLERRSPRQCRVAELRLFSGMQVQEVARVLGVSERTVKEDWRVARTWLARRLKQDVPGSPGA